MVECPECYSSNNKATPLRNKESCLKEHTQYICGTCGRCICIEPDSKRNVRRWNFPFKSLEMAKLYLRTADYTEQNSCGVYQIVDESGRKSYKIFPTSEDFISYLKRTGKHSLTKDALFQREEYIIFPKLK
ncbi:hypothetical protein [Enterococcus sp. HY326]|uniref:hypothetical protein n=1 Tax=Enterococcus sp. HY326 TaxID=2971265 RepID=UPI002ACE8C03|nr:hypothetical protein [Enterococcus sp. HY326]